MYQRENMINKDLHCPYSILSSDIICEHKSARIEQPNTPTLHNHDGYELLLFLNGNANIFVESEEKKLQYGDLIIIPPYLYHGIRVTEIEQYERIVINIRSGTLRDLGDEETDLISMFQPEKGNKFVLIPLTEQQVNDMEPILGNLEKSLNKRIYGHTVLSKAYLTEFLINVANLTMRNSTSDYENIMTPVVKKIFEYIDANIYNEISVNSIALNLHHNVDYLGRIFKNATGSSLKYYINGKKIALAQKLLREGNSPYDVCFILSFNNYSSFSRTFSEHAGMSPKQYVKGL